jgi:fucose permease
VKPLAGIFFRGFLIVTLTASNIGQIAGRHWVGAFVGGFGISFVWWMNSKSAAHSSLRFARECYALGAASGTVFGMWLVRAFYG